MNQKKKNKPMCGCGYGVPTHPFKNLPGLVVHVLGEGSCCRKIARGKLIPTNFRMESWKNTLQEVCTIKGYTITVYTLINQRGYNYHKEEDVWSLPKDEDSINSIEIK